MKVPLKVTFRRNIGLIEVRMSLYKYVPYMACLHIPPGWKVFKESRVYIEFEPPFVFSRKIWSIYFSNHFSPIVASHPPKIIVCFRSPLILYRSFPFEVGKIFHQIDIEQCAMHVIRDFEIVNIIFKLSW